jgi:hypothetical protein
MQWVQMIDGRVGEGPMESEVRLVPVLLEPQQTKLGHHGRVGFFDSCGEVRGESYLLHTVMHVNKKLVMNKNLNPLFQIVSCI